MTCFLICENLCNSGPLVDGRVFCVSSLIIVLLCVLAGEELHLPQAIDGGRRVSSPDRAGGVNSHVAPDEFTIPLQMN